MQTITCRCRRASTGSGGQAGAASIEALNMRLGAPRSAGSSNTSARRITGQVQVQAVLDLLAAHGVIEDDVNVVKDHGIWDTATSPGTVRVSVESVLVMANADV
jgi:hypothetical protein